MLFVQRRLDFPINVFAFPGLAAAKNHGAARSGDVTLTDYPADMVTVVAIDRFTQ